MIGAFDDQAGIGRAGRWLVALTAAVVLAAVGAGVVERLRSPASRAPSEARTSDLDKWAWSGCLHLRVGAPRPSGAHPEALAEDRLSLARVLPEELMLLPDSVDRWGRRLGSHRAVSLSREGSTRRDRPLRWFVRADTLWLLRSVAGDRAGVALFAEGDSLRGQARLVGRDDSVDVWAPAAAWPINCWNRLRKREPPRGRR